MGLGITAGIGISIGEIASLASYYNQLSVNLKNDIEQVVRSIVAMKDQLDSLASVVSKIRGGWSYSLPKNGGSAFS
jgi:predicted histidine transporter YuiF (NhaC family)